MSESVEWTTTIKSVLELLRRALSSLVPIAESARIRWRDGEAYDDWDAIASCLYENIVARTIRYSREAGVDTKLPEYDMLYPSYLEFAFIRVRGDSIPQETTAAFVAFAGSESEFSSVKWVAVAGDGHLADKRVCSADFEKCRFDLQIGCGNADEIQELTVEL